MVAASCVLKASLVCSTHTSCSVLVSLLLLLFGHSQAVQLLEEYVAAHEQAALPPHIWRDMVRRKATPPSLPLFV